ncbi:MAG: tetratricopeptide repeat protein, partial [Chloroflexi bacterium]|nr:tetratricopeptide repeat protein [Chloroflexota bacterium]
QLAYLSAKVYALQGRFTDARASLDGTARFFPNDYDPVVDRGLIAWLGGDTVAARTEWAQVTASDWLYRLSQYWGERLPESLMATVLTALTTGANQSTRASAYESLGDLYRYRQEYIAALPFYVQAVELQPDKTLPHIKLAVTYNGLGRRPEAYEELARAAALPGISPVERADAYQWIGTLQIYDGRWDDAAGSYTTALAYDPGNANYLLRRGWLRVKIGQPEAALADVQAALLHAQSLRNPVTAYVVRAQALMALRCYREAAGALDAAKRLDATDAEYQAAAAQFQRLVGVAGGEGKDCPALAHSP